jgi:hypothetical protein
MRSAGRLRREATPPSFRIGAGLAVQQPATVQWKSAFAAGVEAAATDPSNAAANRVMSTCFTVSSSMSGGRVPPLARKMRRASVATLRRR